MLKKNEELRKLRKLLAGKERRWRERGVEKREDGRRVELFGFYEDVSVLCVCGECVHLIAAMRDFSVLFMMR
jgi:hypothetical protein